MHELAKRIFVVLGVVLIGMQFVPTANKLGCASSRVHMVDVIDPNVGAILDRSCNDCHSANTHWPWYSWVAPVSWIVARDVQRGRAKLDFADWASRSHSGNERMEICDAVSNGSMPMKAYTLLHHDSRLNSQEVDRICDWAASLDTPASVRKPRAVGATAIAPAKY
jgi:hypothetical protein